MSTIGRIFAATLFGLLVVAAPSAALAQGVVPAVAVTDDGTLSRSHEAPAVVIDRDDPDTVYVADSEVATGNCQFHVSHDRGRTWTELDPPSYDGWTDCGLGSVGPKNIRVELRQAPDGTLLYLYHGNEPGGSRSVLLGRSGDGGASWDTNAVYEAPEADALEDVELNFLGHMAIDPDDPERMVVMWRRSFPTLPDEEMPRPTRPWMAISTDGGATWGDAFEMFEDNIGFDGPRPVIADGRLYAFHRVRPGPDEPEDAPNLVAVSVSEDEGETWDRTVIVEANDVSEPVATYDADRGMFYAAWHDNRNDNLDVFFSRSRDGEEWSEPVRLNDDSEENTIGQFYPRIAMSPDGRIDVAWYDYRDDTYPPPVPDEDDTLNLFNNVGKQQSVYLVSSEDGGATWGPNRRVNDVRIDRTIGLWDPTFFFQVPLDLAAWNDGTIVAWSDTRNGDATTGTQDIVTAALLGEAAKDAGTSRFVLGGIAGLALGAGLAALGMMAIARRRQVTAAA